LNEWLAAGRATIGPSSASIAASHISVGTGPASNESLSSPELGALAWVPGAPALDDEQESNRIIRLAELDPAAALSAVSEDRRQQLIPFFGMPRMELLSVQLASNVSDYSARAVHAIDVCFGKRPTKWIDLSIALPSQAKTTHQRECVALLLHSLRQHGELNPADRADASRSASLLGSTCIALNNPEAAMDCLTAARSLDLESGEHCLWCADLARLMGFEAQAKVMEMQSFSDGVMPSRLTLK
jgi:hypothetical protein